jgi:threonine dehydratase
MPAKIQAIRDLGAEIVEIDGPALAAELEARRQSELTGKPYVAPYNDYDTIAGQGTIGAELARQHKDLDAVFVCVGGGGLVSGIGVALKQLSPKTRIIGVSPEASRCMFESLKAGRIIEFEEHPTLSDASLGDVEPGSVTFPLCQQVIDHTIVVSEREIARAMRMVAQSDGWMVEGTAGVALAGLVQQAEAFRGQNVAIVLCGRNVTVDTFVSAMALAGPTELETATV